MPSHANTVVNPGFEDTGVLDWVAYGERTSITRSNTDPHSGQACLHVFDNGDEGGQANNPYSVAPPGLHYVEGWVRVDPEHRSTVLFDAQFFDAERKYLGPGRIGQTESTEWTCVAGFAVVPEECAYVRLRVQPAWAFGGSGKLRGACFIDDLYMAPAEQARAEGAIRAKHEVKPCPNADPEGGVGEPPPDIAGKPQAHESQIDFEDLAGWEMEVFGDVRASFCRSRQEQLTGTFVGKLTYGATDNWGWVVLRPPKPIPLGGRFDAAQLWCHSQRRTHPHTAAPRVTIIVRENGKLRGLTLPHVHWSFWSIAHRRLPKPIGPNAEIVELWFDHLKTEPDETRAFCFDELAFHNEPTESLDLKIPEIPCPTRPETILPTFTGAFSNGVTERGDAYRLWCQGESERIEYKYRPQTSTLDDLEVVVNGGPGFHPAAGGGPVFDPEALDLAPDRESPQAELLRAKVEDDTVVAVWRHRSREETAEVTWRLTIRGKSLVLTVDEPTGKLAAWHLGKPDGESVEEIAVPYLTNHCGAGPVFLVDKGPFVFRQPDWYVTHASIFTPEACEYVPLLNRKRNPLHERIFLTVSSDFHEVLPNIPNPKSPAAHVLGENVYVNMSGSLAEDALERCLTFWREMKRLGMDKLIVKHHAHTFSDHSGQGNEPFVQRLKAARNIPGGGAALAKYIEQVKALGMQYFLYTDYCIFAPVCEHFDEGLVSLDPEGTWKPGWYSYFALTPLMAPVLAERLAPRLKARYGLTGSYCDQHTSPPPSRWVDYDPRKPGAGMLQTVFRAYCKVFEIEKKAYQGPVVSEGGNYWFYAGMVDGNYAQLIPPKGVKRWEMPFLVDFDLLKIHPLQVDLGMGWRGSYGYDPYAKNPDDALDRFLAATIAFGHSGILYGDKPGVWQIEPEDPLGKWKESIKRTYFMTQELASRYAMVPVRSIRYWDGTKLLPTSDAIRSGAYKRSQVHVEYENGLRVWVNGSFDQTWRVEADGETYELPAHGWLAQQGEEFLEFSARRDGRRVDRVRAPAYTYDNQRETPVE